MSLPKTLRFGIQSLDKLIGTISLEDGTERFGINLAKPSGENGIETNYRTPAPIISSICLTGPDGMGKSVFSMHLASQYLADCIREAKTTTNSKRELPRVLYISTDLSYKMALKGWLDFALDAPLSRQEPLVELEEGVKSPASKPIKIKLTQYLPTESLNSPQSVVNYLEDPVYHFSDNEIAAQVCFVDLASRTAGDDWGFLHRLLSLLENPSDDQAPHLVVIDAVEGFETLVGDLNAFGEESSRRSRIAQVMRLVSGKSHLLMVVEEARDERFPEEFVTDVVIRLRSIGTGRYLRRTLEVEKTRGQFHIRGQHSFVIRDGKGSTTGNQSNADDPEVFKDRSTGQHQSYVHVFPSLNYISREIMIDKYNPRGIAIDKKYAAFGIPFLDNMLGGTGAKAERDQNEYDTRGLPCGSATALIGDSLTQKGQLGKAFLSRAFYSCAKKVNTRVREIAATPDAIAIQDEIDEGIQKVARGEIPGKAVAEKVKQRLDSLIHKLRASIENSSPHPVTILFTTQDLNHESLVDEYYKWLRDQDTLFEIGDHAHGSDHKEKDKDSEAHFLQQLTNRIEEFAKDYIDRNVSYVEFKESPIYNRGTKRFREFLIKKAFQTELRRHIQVHTICRRFEIHDLPASVLMNILQRNVEKAQRIMFGIKRDEPLPKTPACFQNSARIRVVIDDLNGLRNAYPEMRDDPLMLPALLFMLGREGVTSLIVDTQASGSPELSISERFESSVRELVQHRIYIWRLPFYGENRVAISLIPPISQDYRGLIRELRWETKDGSRDTALTVDPHFELYMGLEKGLPRPVPLEVRLYADTPTADKYIATEEKFLSEIFTAVPKTNLEPRVIVKVETNDYDALRDACHLQRGTRLDHTMILQVNEFWWLRRPRQRRAGSFRRQWDYLNSVTATKTTKGYSSEPVVDPFWVFQPSPATKTASASQNGLDLKLNKMRRLNFFDEDCGYNLKDAGKEEQESIDRVPYTWDFGFLLCNAYAWQQAFGLSIDKDSNETKVTVKNVWDALYRATKDSRQNANDLKNSLLPESVSWRDFLAASKTVAEFQSYRTSAPATAFDFTMLIPESFSCLILEMWLSESYDSLQNYKDRSRSDEEREKFEAKKRMLQAVGKRRWHLEAENPVTLLSGLEGDKGKSLGDILQTRHETREIQSKSFSLELYKIWLLLIDAINFEELVDSSSHLNFEFKSRDVSPQAVSARHWYKTASKFIDSLRPEQLEYNWVPVRLPGHFSVRADWFLAVAGGSRSGRLADHALDLLSSRRSNITRMQDGIGLPTRRLFDTNENGAHLRTHLIASPQAGEPLLNVEYDLLRQIGAGAQSNQKDFYWLWRSGIWAYNRHSRVWHKWLNRALLWWHSWHQRHGSNWKSGFEVYDLLTEMEFGDDPESQQDQLTLKNLDSWNEFHKLRDILIAELEQVSISTV